MSLTESDNALLQRIALQVAKPVAIEPEAALDVKLVEQPNCHKTWSLSGFSAKSRVLTSFGYVPMEALRRRDPVKTFDGRFLEVEFVDEIKLDRRYLIDHPEAQPILLPRHSLGASRPTTEMFVSGAQRLKINDRVHNDQGVLAEEMIGRAGIMRKSHGYFTYYRFHCGEPCTVHVDGIWCEIDPAPMGMEH